MRVRIVRPLPEQLEGLDVSHFGFGASYEIASPLCDVLLLLGYAIPVDLESLRTYSTPAATSRLRRQRRRPRSGRDSKR
jgi:hypothetical protein